MSAQEDAGGGEKSHEPTEKRLMDARKKGDVARSGDISTAAAYLGLILALVVFGASMRAHVGQDLTAMIAQAESLSGTLFHPGGGVVAAMLIARVLMHTAPIFILPLVLTFLAVIAQRVLIFATSKLSPKLSRISPLSAVRNKFGRNGLFEFGKSFVKLVVVALGVEVFVAQNFNVMIGSVRSDAILTIGLIGRNLISFIWFVFLLSAAIAALDYIWQVFDHKRKLMMTRKEITDEAKESEGDPHFKQTRRKRGYDIATQQMISDVPGADVIVVNPEHYAIALKWDRDSRAAPICLAKGVDEIAARIREVAAKSGVPIYRDPPTARAIYSTIEVGQEIHEEHYKAVAAAIRYAEKIRAMTGARHP